MHFCSRRQRGKAKDRMQCKKCLILFLQLITQCEKKKRHLGLSFTHSPNHKDILKTELPTHEFQNKKVNLAKESIKLVEAGIAGVTD